MRIQLLLTAAVALALAGCGGSSDFANEVNPAAAEGNAAIGPADAPDGTIPTPGAAQTARNGQEYVALAGASDLYEIEAARLAIEKATHDEVRTLAQAILADHQRSTTQLSAAAREADPVLTMPSEMNAQQQADVDALRAASGAAFGTLFLDQQVRAHEQALTLVTAYASEGDVEALRRHASTVAGPIQAHLSQARALVEQAAQPEPGASASNQ